MMPCGCDTTRRCPEALDLIIRVVELMMAVRLAQRIGNSTLIRRAGQMYLDRNNEFLRHARGETV